MAAVSANIVFCRASVTDTVAARSSANAAAARVPAATGPIAAAGARFRGSRAALGAVGVRGHAAARVTRGSPLCAIAELKMDTKTEELTEEPALESAVSARASRRSPWPPPTPSLSFFHFSRGKKDITSPTLVDFGRVEKRRTRRTRPRASARTFTSVSTRSMASKVEILASYSILRAARGRSCTACERFHGRRVTAATS